MGGRGFHKSSTLSLSKECLINHTSISKNKQSIFAQVSFQDYDRWTTLGATVSNSAKTVYTFFSILKLSTPCILAINHFFLFQLIARNMLNTYIYHELSPTCFGVCHTIIELLLLSNSLVVSLKLVWQTPKHVEDNWWQIYVFNILCAVSWNAKTLFV